MTSGERAVAGAGDEVLGRERAERGSRRWARAHRAGRGVVLQSCA